MTTDIVVSVSIFFITFGLMICRPRIPRLERFIGPNITVGKATLIGAILVSLTGLITIEDFLRIIETVALPLAVLISLSIIALCCGEAGVFDWASLKVARASHGNPRKLLRNIYWLSAIFTVLFPNDANILIFTPLIIVMLRTIRTADWNTATPVPFLFAVIFGSNAGSITLITSNPINLIAASHFGLSFLEYAKWMILPGIASAFTCYVMLVWTLKTQLPPSYRTEGLKDPKAAITDERLFNVSVFVVIAVFAAYFLLPVFGIPFHYAVFVGALVIIIPVALNGKTSAIRVIRHNPWDEIAFVVCLFMVVFGLKTVGLTSLLGKVMNAISGTTALQTIMANVTLIFAGTSITNDWPMIMISSLSIDGVNTLPLASKHVLPYVAVLGTDLGAMVIPSASLATLIWMGIIRRMAHTEISWRRFIMVGITVTPFTLLAASLVLWLESFVFRQL